MAEVMEPGTPEEAAALRALEVKHRRRRRWFALLSSVIVSFHATAILCTLWHGWPLAAHALWWLAFFVMNAVVGLAWLAWGLRNLREEEALDRQWALQTVRWRARDRAWRDQWTESRWQPGEGQG